MKKIFVVISIIISVIFNSYSQNIPERPSPPRLVNDFAGFLSTAEAAILEQKLDLFNDSTSTQIAVVIVKDIDDDPNHFAAALGEKWGVGQKGKNNGIVILIKPKTTGSNGAAVIQVGYGLEPVIPDAIAKRIVEKEMIPAFKENNYFKGIDASVNVLMALAEKEFTASAYVKKPKKKVSFGFLFSIIMVIIVFFVSGAQSSKNSRHHTIGRSGGIGFIGSGGSGSWGNFSSGSDGFSGFGGGSFGGGGASGSW
jgi:uncharacterized protein